MVNPLKQKKLGSKSSALARENLSSNSSHCSHLWGQALQTSNHGPCELLSWTETTQNDLLQKSWVIFIKRFIVRNSQKLEEVDRVGKSMQFLFLSCFFTRKSRGPVPKLSPILSSRSLSFRQCQTAAEGYGCEFPIPTTALKLQIVF